MVEKLTKEQEAKFPEYVDKYIKLGLSTKPLTEESKAQITEILGRVYQVGGLKAPERVLFFSNPVEMCAYAKFCGDDSPTSGFIYGSFDAGWLSFYNFFKNEVPEVKGTEIIEPLTDLLSLCSLCIPYDDVCLVSQNPTKILKNANGLHAENESALEYQNDPGFAQMEPIYSLNGIQVPDWAILTPKDQLDPKKVLAITNVDQRREVLRKMGPENLLKKMNAKTLEKAVVTEENCKTFGLRPPFRKADLDYVLYELDFGDNMKVRYLKMDNPSVDAIHIEGVTNECETILDALAFRNQRALEALGITNPTGKNWIPPTQLT